MKKILITLSVAAIALTGCNQDGGTTASANLDSILASGVATSAQIAYIDMDSLLANYDMYLDLAAEFNAKMQRADQDITSRARSFERDVNDLQDRANRGLLTSRQIATQEEELGRRQQALIQSRDDILQQLAEEETVMLNQIHYAITSYLAEFNADYRYGIILATSGNSPVLHADPQLNITSIVLNALNSMYAAERGRR